MTHACYDQLLPPALNSTLFDNTVTMIEAMGALTLNYNNSIVAKIGVASLVGDVIEAMEQV
jgi:hypothetical protein